MNWYVPAYGVADFIINRSDQAYNKCVDKRSDVGEKALAVVNELFKQPEFADAAARKKYARWALSASGPLLYSEPAEPKSGQVFIFSLTHMSPNSPIYFQKPKGAFLSPHIVNVIKRTFPTCKSLSVIDVGIPVGLLGLAAAGMSHRFS
ncbi:hypothetical protein VKT23_015893 [Stygiomarasmius scandens]|uniref:Uncharacterized protein n=1 Tax=Marasmiellus scandens TaxID=2682957 RepID=A0ABR1IZ54_9AGAR